MSDLATEYRLPYGTSAADIAKRAQRRWCAVEDSVESQTSTYSDTFDRAIYRAGGVREHHSVTPLPMVVWQEPISTHEPLFRAAPAEPALVADLPSGAVTARISEFVGIRRLLAVTWRDCGSRSRAC